MESGTTPLRVFTFARVIMAFCEMSKPSEIVSMAVTKIEVPWDVSFQHDPHAVEFQFLTAKTPPMPGKEGSEAKVEKPLVIKPLTPSEHATLFSEVWGLS